MEAGLTYGLPALDVEPELHRIASPINVTSVCDVNDPYDDTVVENLVEHPEFASPGRVPALKLIPQRFSYPVRIFGERATDEFPACDGDRLGKAAGQRVLRSPGQLDAISHCASRPAARISSVTSSSE